MTQPLPPPEPPPPGSVATANEPPTGVVVAQGTGIVSPGKLDAFTLPEDAAVRSRAVMRLLAGHNDDKHHPGLVDAGWPWHRARPAPGDERAG